MRRELPQTLERHGEEVGLLTAAPQCRRKGVPTDRCAGMTGMGERRVGDTGARRQRAGALV